MVVNTIWRSHPSGHHCSFILGSMLITNIVLWHGHTPRKKLNLMDVNKSTKFNSSPNQNAMRHDYIYIRTSNVLLGLDTVANTNSEAENGTSSSSHPWNINTGSTIAESCCLISLIADNAWAPHFAFSGPWYIRGSLLYLWTYNMTHH